ncbi:hypothetical protein, partial [Candidatus Hakubella thermalkaliphila]|uniref:hypothetical protein n=1 Tax=Candidatus Hakubella thermalkaliphila TaxID=2754717 RepID=UPI001C6165CC
MGTFETNLHYLIQNLFQILSFHLPRVVLKGIGRQGIGDNLRVIAGGLPLSVAAPRKDVMD